MSLRQRIRQLKRFIIYRVLHADDTPHRLALGIALGFFIAWTPTIGLQMLIVIVLATLLGANKLVGLPWVWISNPFTIVPIYYSNYVVGRFIVTMFTKRPSRSYEDIQGLFDQLYSAGLWPAVLSWEAWRHFWRVLFGVALELWVGSVLVGTLVGVIAYVVFYRLIVFYRAHRPNWRLPRPRRRRRRHRPTAPKETVDD